MFIQQRLTKSKYFISYKSVPLTYLDFVIYYKWHFNYIHFFILQTVYSVSHYSMLDPFIVSLLIEIPLSCLKVHVVVNCSICYCLFSSYMYLKTD